MTGRVQNTIRQILRDREKQGAGMSIPALAKAMDMDLSKGQWRVRSALYAMPDVYIRAWELNEYGNSYRPIWGIALVPPSVPRPKHWSA